VLQTEGEPPSSGSTILVNIGWTKNKRTALKKTVAIHRLRRMRLDATGSWDATDREEFCIVSGLERTDVVSSP
jgi:hypothetical protein